ncbi:MAG TPA: TonB-dependent receptor [Terriglobia bacterium]|nr:TonB-dependent receptor [Terriglobia bacterium]
MKRLAGAFWLIAICGFALRAANGPRVIEGIVQDPLGAIVADAEVTLRSGAEQKVMATTTTDEYGHFEFLSLLAGDYVVEVTAPGLQAQQAAVNIGSVPVAPLRISLRLAGTKQEITVRATAGVGVAPSVTENAAALSIDQGALQGLPAEGDDPLAIPSLFVEPAATGAQGPSIVVDGVETNSLDVPVASILEVRVNQNPYAAEFQRPGTGRIEVTTRKGSYHHYRGLLSELFRNSALDARNPFATVTPPLQRSVTEGQLSGPLAKHVSLFLAGRYYYDKETAVINAQTPTGLLVENFGTPERNNYAYGRLDFALSPTQDLTVAYKFKDKSKQNRNVGGFDLPDRAVNLFDRENELKVFENAILSSRLLNDFRFTYLEERQGTDSLVNQPAILVPGAFKSGGAQTILHQTERAASLQDIMSFVTERHTIRFGGGIRPRLFDTYDASNFGGTYSFASLSTYAAGAPYLFTINQGNPAVSYSQKEYFSFFDDDFKVNRRLSLSAGVRYEGQSNLHDYNNVAPRLALAYALGQKTVLRAGAGVFYDHQPDIFQQQALLYNGQQVRQIVLENPPFPVPLPGSSGLSLAPPSIVTIAPGIQTPYLIQGSVTVERKLNERSYLTFDFTTLRGLKLYLTRNINAPLPATGQRPNPNYVNIDQFESSGRSRSNILTVTYRTALRSHFDLFAQYAFSRSTDNTSGFLFLPANNYDLTSEYGRSDFDRRHRFKVFGTYEMPWGFDAGAILNLSSGIPFNITTGFDNNHDTVANDRPPGVGRNTGLGPGYADLDLHLSKNFRLRREYAKPKLEIGVDAFNLLNATNDKSFVGVLTSPYFGRAEAANPARELQISLRFKF